MFRKSLIALVVVLLSVSACYAGNAESVRFLAKHGYAVTADADKFVISCLGGEKWPFFKIEKLPALYFNMPELKKQRLAEVAASIGDKRFETREIVNGVIERQATPRYRLSIDANFDGVVDSFVGPTPFASFEFMEATRPLRVPVPFVFTNFSKFYYLMPTFATAEFAIGDGLDLPYRKHKLDDTVKNIHHDEFMISKIRLVAEADGNLTVKLIDDRTPSRMLPREVKLQTGIKW